MICKKSIQSRPDLIKRRTMLGVIKAVDKTKQKSKSPDVANQPNVSFVTDKFENDSDIADADHYISN
jgi:hypothetical protein